MFLPSIALSSAQRSAKTKGMDGGLREDRLETLKKTGKLIQVTCGHDEPDALLSHAL